MRNWLFLSERKPVSFFMDMGLLHVINTLLVLKDNTICIIINAVYVCVEQCIED